MTAASGDPGEMPDSEHRSAVTGSDAPPADPAYAEWAAPPAPSPAQSHPPGHQQAYPSIPVAYPITGGPPPPPGYHSGPAYLPPPAYPPPHPPYPGYGYPANVAPATSSLAIVSLIASISGLLCFLGALVGVVTGVVALVQIRSSRQSGFALAVAGIVLGVVLLLAEFGLLLMALSRPAG